MLILALSDMDSSDYAKRRRVLQPWERGFAATVLDPSSSRTAIQAQLDSVLRPSWSSEFIRAATAVSSFTAIVVSTAGEVVEDAAIAAHAPLDAAFLKAARTREHLGRGEHQTTARGIEHWRDGS